MRQCGAEAGDLSAKYQIYRAHPVGARGHRAVAITRSTNWHHRYPELPPPALSASAAPFESLRKESVDVRHGGGEVAAAEAG